MTGSADRPAWHALSVADVLLRLKTDPDAGLTADEALLRLRQYGRNEISAEAPTSRLRIFLRQFKSPVVITLLVATALSALLGDWIDAGAIATILIINSLIGYFQEIRAEEAVAALKKLTSPRGRVLRDGKIVEIASEEICPGDILVLESGDFIPADARVVQANQLSSGEAILTGESLPVGKSVAPVDSKVPLAERINMLFGGTTVATGSGRAIVTATAMETEIGRIAGLLEKTQSEPTPLQIRLERLSNRLLLLCAGVVALVALFGILHGERWLDVLLSGVSLAVAAVPEGLPTVVTLTLALAVRRMVKRNAIVRHLPAVETLGSVDVICSDKTGTLTTGKMRVRELHVGGRLVEAAGLSIGTDDALKRLVQVSTLCCNASLQADGKSTGDPTEVALLWLARDLQIDLAGINKTFPRRAEWAFDSVRKRMSIVVEENGKQLLCVKGAPESLLPLCSLDEGRRKEIQGGIDVLTGKGRRLLAVAERVPPPGLKPSDSAADVEKDLSFLGLVAIADPPRPESAAAIQDCKRGGITVVMITGDHPVTAKTIAGELGILEPGEREEVLSGPDLDRMSPEELRTRVDRVAVFARVSPENKLEIVRAWKSRGSVVAMTGDGVNDAPALKEASIGISMGRGGTEVARQASAMILTDDNFATIVSAVEEGRAIYGNIRRTIGFLLSGNFAEILVMLGAAALGWPAPLAPIHLLWINLVTDGLPALALASEPVPAAGLREMSRPSPRGFDRAFYGGIAWIGLLSAVMTLGVYGYSLQHHDEATARSNAFSFLVFIELFRSFASRSETKTFLEMGVKSNLFHLFAAGIPIAFQMLLHHSRLFDSVFKVRPIGWTECMIFLGLSLVPVTIIEVWKLVRRRRE